MDDAERQLLTEVARRFYLEDESKTELAKSLRVSRFKIARLLQQAREQGIVTIEINEDEGYRSALSAELAEHLALLECVVVKSGDTEEDNRRRLARAAAAYITNHTHEGDVLGFSWGRTLVAIGEHLGELPAATIVQLTGTVGNDFTQSPVEVIRRIVGRSSVEAMAIFSPLFAASHEAAQSLRDDTSIRQTIARYADLTLAVLSVGSWDPQITQLAVILGKDDLEELAHERAKAEMAGIFVRADGSVVEASVTRRRISVSVSELLNTPRVLAVAGSAEKVGAISAVARSGLITSLVTDDLTAALLLKQYPSVEVPRLSRRTLP